MQNKELIFLDKKHTIFRQDAISGRYVTLENIEPIIKKLPNQFSVIEIGKSFKSKSIYKITIGTGKIKVLMWSQMHGNESTGTKAMFDLFNFIINPLDLENLRDTILNNCTLICIPMLNPDGAKAYTRLSAQKIDLNRDVIAIKAPESKLLQDVLHAINPQYCFNLHDQRTIFSVGESNNPATLSFLAPSEEKERIVTNGRKKTMRIISGMFKDLSHILPNQIGRYTDEFYPTATGDNFQKEGYNTILIEAGHFKNDYERALTRKYNFIALISGLVQMYSRKTNYKTYFKIPENKKQYLDLIYTNLIINSVKITYGVLFKEELKGGHIVFKPEITMLDGKLSYNSNKLVLKELQFKNLQEFELYLLKKQFVI